jgi:hypothetical protein
VTVAPARRSFNAHRKPILTRAPVTTTTAPSRFAFSSRCRGGEAFELTREAPPQKKAKFVEKSLRLYIHLFPVEVGARWTKICVEEVKILMERTRDATSRNGHASFDAAPIPFFVSIYLFYTRAKLA